MPKFFFKKRLLPALVRKPEWPRVPWREQGPSGQVDVPGNPPNTGPAPRGYWAPWSATRWRARGCMRGRPESHARAPAGPESSLTARQRCPSRRPGAAGNSRGRAGPPRAAARAGEGEAGRRRSQSHRVCRLTPTATRPRLWGSSSVQPAVPPASSRQGSGHAGGMVWSTRCPGPCPGASRALREGSRPPLLVTALRASPRPQPLRPRFPFSPRGSHGPPSSGQLPARQQLRSS